ncbi:hypothetical protein [Cryptosporangium arvum]|uniref:Uncharacterized protein n=1 Tax=Cryptosporangium arvum DSM 44712 TaxID=927661 RepID=A0A010ZMH7_9ACTN|nr:hypothetical protein [Cryptosporangium arvum]EXG79869.1 hypothetical protein CryarDRAFT_0919 [Cryptosporangium arvum DSM 44712]
MTDLGAFARGLSLLSPRDDETYRAMARLFGYDVAPTVPNPESISVERPYIVQDRRIDASEGATAPDTRIPPLDVSASAAGKSPQEAGIPASLTRYEPRLMVEKELRDKLEDGVRLPPVPPLVSSARNIDTLFRPSWQREIIKELATIETFTDEPSVESLVEALATGKAIAALPATTRIDVNPRVRVLIDTAQSMLPFTEDQALFAAALQRVLGKPMVAVERLRNAPQQVSAEGGARWSPAIASLGESLIVVSDLGMTRHLVKQGFTTVYWIDFARSSFAASGLRPVAVVPCSLGLVPDLVRKAFAVIPWDRPTSPGLVGRVSRG